MPGNCRATHCFIQRFPPSTYDCAIYVGELYEEDIANPSPAYTSYYSFSGKLVGMRMPTSPHLTASTASWVTI